MTLGSERNFRKSTGEEHATARAAEPDLSLLADAAPILVRLGRFPDAVRSAAAHAEPSEVSTWLLATSRELNS